MPGASGLPVAQLSLELAGRSQAVGAAPAALRVRAAAASRALRATYSRLELSADFRVVLDPAYPIARTSADGRVLAASHVAVGPGLSPSSLPISALTVGLLPYPTGPDAATGPWMAGAPPAVRAALPADPASQPAEAELPVPSATEAYSVVLLAVVASGADVDTAAQGLTAAAAHIEMRTSTAGGGGGALSLTCSARTLLLTGTAFSSVTLDPSVAAPTLGSALLAASAAARGCELPRVQGPHVLAAGPVTVSPGLASNYSPFHLHAMLWPLAPGQAMPQQPDVLAAVDLGAGSVASAPDGVLHARFGSGASTNFAGGVDIRGLQKGQRYAVVTVAVDTRHRYLTFSAYEITSIIAPQIVDLTVTPYVVSAVLRFWVLDVDTRSRPTVEVGILADGDAGPPQMLPLSPAPYQEATSRAAVEHRFDGLLPATGYTVAVRMQERTGLFEEAVYREFGFLTFPLPLLALTTARVGFTALEVSASTLHHAGSLVVELAGPPPSHDSWMEPAPRRSAARRFRYAGLAPGAAYTVEAVATCPEDPLLLVRRQLLLRTLDAPILLLGEPATTYITAAFSVSLAESRLPVTLVAAVLPDTGDPDALALARLVAEGSQAYPPGHAAVVPGVSDRELPLFVSGLEPGTLYRFLAGILEPEDGFVHTVSRRSATFTAPRPSAAFRIPSHTQAVVSGEATADAGAAAPPFNLHVFVAGPFPAEAAVSVDPDWVPVAASLHPAAYSLAPSDAAGAASVPAHAMYGLLRGSWYAAAAVASDPAAPLERRSVAVSASAFPTPALPSISVSGLALTPEAAGFRVQAQDADTGYALATALLHAQPTEADARALVEQGTSFAGPTLVPGTATAAALGPGPYEADVSIAAGAGGLKPAPADTYYAVAAVRDGLTGEVGFDFKAFRWPGRPPIALGPASATTAAISAAWSVTWDRPYTVTYALTPSPWTGATAAQAAALPGAATFPGSAGPPSLDFGGLALGSGPWDVVAFATDDLGWSGPAVALTVEMPSEAVLGLALTQVRSAALLVEASASTERGSVYVTLSVVAGAMSAAEAASAQAVASVSGGASPGSPFALSGQLTDLLAPSSQYTALLLATYPDGATTSRAQSFVTRPRPAGTWTVEASHDSVLPSSRLLVSVAEADPARPEPSYWVYAKAVGPADGPGQHPDLSPPPALSRAFDPAAPMAVDSGSPASVASGFSAAGASAPIPLAGSGFAPSTSARLLLRLVDAATGEAFDFSADVTLRGLISIRAALRDAGGTPSSATVDVRASISSGLLALTRRVYQKVVLAGDPEADPEAASLVPPAELVASGVPAADLADQLAGLTPGTAYSAVYVATDPGAPPMRRAAVVVFETSTDPPALVVHADRGVVGVDSVSVPFTVTNRWSPAVAYASARPAAAPGPADPLDLVADHGFRGEAPRGPTGTLLQAFFGGLQQSTRYAVTVLALDSRGGSAVEVVEVTTGSHTNMRRDAEFDGTWRLSWRSGVHYALPARGAFSGNGKVSIRCSLDAVAATPTIIAGSAGPGAFGGAAGSVSRGFDALTLRLGSPVAALAEPWAVTSQRLDTYSGIVTTAASAGGVDVEADFMALRGMPYCAMVTARLTARRDQPGLLLYHVASGPPGAAPPDYGCGLLHGVGAEGEPVAVMRATCALRGSADELSMACAYYPPAGAAFLGHNTLREPDAQSFAAWRLPPLAAGQTAEFSVLCAQASSSDMRSHAEAAQRMVVTAKATRPAAADLRLQHVRAWSELWRARVRVDLRAGLLAEEHAAAEALRRALLFAQYSLYACTRDDCVTDIDEGLLGPAPIRADSAPLSWGRELWLLPAMLYLRPAVARGMLQRRFESLRLSRALAAGTGAAGARFPGEYDITAADITPYWDVDGASFVFNTALVGVAAWDYYRATKDRDWLATSGWPVISGAADYVLSCHRGGLLRRSRGLSGRALDSPAFTVYSAKLALRAGVEAAYDLRYPHRGDWLESFRELDLATLPGPLFRVVAEHAAHGPADLSTALEAMAPLQTHYCQPYLAALGAASSNRAALRDSVAHYRSRLDPAHARDPFALLMLADAYAQLSTTFPGSEADAHALLTDAVDAAASDIWGALSTQPETGRNDPSLSARLVLTVLAAAGAHVTGGVTVNGFTYERMGITTATIAYLPRAWDAVVLTDAAGTARRVLNRNPYTAPPAPSPRPPTVTGAGGLAEVLAAALDGSGSAWTQDPVTGAYRAPPGATLNLALDLRGDRTALLVFGHPAAGAPAAMTVRVASVTTFGTFAYSEAVHATEPPAGELTDVPPGPGMRAFAFRWEARNASPSWVAVDAPSGALYPFVPPVFSMGQSAVGGANALQLSPASADPLGHLFAPAGIRVLDHYVDDATLSALALAAIRG